MYNNNFQGCHEAVGLPNSCFLLHPCTMVKPMTMYCFSCLANAMHGDVCRRFAAYEVTYGHAPHTASLCARCAQRGSKKWLKSALFWQHPHLKSFKCLYMSLRNPRVSHNVTRHGFAVFFLA